jgi:hypothetical protein
MRKQGLRDVLSRLLRTAILTDVILAMIIGLLSFLLGFRSMEAFETFLTWAGFGLIFFACFISVGGVSARVQDISAFQISRAGDLSENLMRISESGRSSFGCFLLLLIAGLGLVVLAYLLPLISLLMGFLVRSSS